MLTPEQLDLLKRLQCKIKEAMGEWQIGDEGVDIPFGDKVLFVKMTTEGTYTFVSDKNVVFWLSSTDLVLRVPKPIDWQNPKRGLWGMIKGEKQLEEGTTFCIVWRGYKFSEASDPFTALLKALAEQEKV